jgi:amino acid adenylation domain-containing protein
VYDNDRPYTFLDIHTLSDRLAAGLQRLGVHRGDRVVACLGNRVESIVAFWAVLKAGGVVVNISVDVPPGTLSYILKDSEASILIATDKNLEELGGSINGFPFIKSTICVGGNVSDTSSSSYEDIVNQENVELSPIRVIDQDLAAIIYTSGSTGDPKGVMMTHKNMLAALTSLNAYLGYQETDIVLCSLPLSFDYGLYQMLMSIKSGATLILEKEFTWPIFLIKKINQYQITIIPFVPTMLVLLHEYANKSGMKFPSLRVVTNTGAALKKVHIEMIKSLFPKALIYSMYGLTECKRCTYLPPSDIDSKPESIGIAIPNTEFWLVDDEGNRINEPDTVGELVIRGSTVMAGYWKKPEATAKRLKKGPVSEEKVLYTGDYCSMDEDGYLYFQGRVDSVIKSRGMKVSPVEVEKYLYSMQGIEAAVVVGVSDDERGEALFGFVQFTPEGHISSSKILEMCRDNLEAYKVPKYISIVKNLPRTGNGKFDVLALGAIANRETYSATL